MTELELAKKIVGLIDAKKGEDIKLLDIHEHTTLGDYFIIATAQNAPQVKAIADEIDEQLGKLGIEARSFEGYNTYAHVTAQMKQDAADAIGGVISQQMR